MKSYIKTVGKALILIVGMGFTACTDSFEGWNVNPNEATPEMMEHDNLYTSAFFTQIERNVFIVGKDKGGEYQITETLAGDIFAGYMANINIFSYATYHNAHYQLYHGWYDAAFNDAYTDIMQPWYAIKQRAEKETPAVYALATIVKVLGMSRITDMYGPIPYSQFGGSLNVPYDSQKDVYYTFFDELGAAITTLTGYYHANSTARVLSEYDYIYGGDVKKWIKFANTLRLRLAMRLSYVDAGKAETEAKAAISHEIGLMASSDDSAILNQSSNLTFINPIWEISESFKDTRMGASMDSYLNGYEDPRLAACFRPALNDGGYHGVRNGLRITGKDRYINPYSGVNYESGDGLLWMDASEAYFLLAEAKLRWDLGTGTVQSFYEQGITVSFASKGVSGAAAYIADNMRTPADYEDIVGWDDATALTDITVAWDDNASLEKKLERIITQKWIAIFPDGQEAWSELRRTGYPKLFPIVSNQSNGEVDTDKRIRRLKFPSTEYSRNTQNVNDALGLLGGPDTGRTNLWWDANTNN